MILRSSAAFLICFSVLSAWATEPSTEARLTSGQSYVRDGQGLLNSLPRKDASRPQLTLKLADALFNDALTLGALTHPTSAQEQRLEQERKKSLHFYQEALNGIGGAYPLPVGAAKDKIEFQISRLESDLGNSQAAQKIWKVEFGANIGGLADAKQAVEMGCDGVGLLRSEFLFLERATAPSEEEQFQVYQEIAHTMERRPLTIRTLDVGGDKPLQYLPLPKEDNPFLGLRGIRVGFKHPEILREQLRAILRVRSEGKINIMFPMISTIEEFRKAKSMLEEERAKLSVPASQIAVGIMVEVPSAALLADVFAPEVDFFE